MEIPFRTGEIVCAPHFTGRRAEVTRIRQAMWSRKRLLVTGERQEGKRSAVREAFLPLEGRGALFLGVDLWTAEGPLDILRRLVARVSPQWPRSSRLQKMLTAAGLRPRVVDSEGDSHLTLTVRGVALRPGEASRHLRDVVLFLDEMAATHPSPTVLALYRVHRPVPGFTEDAGSTDDSSLLGELVAKTRHLSWIFTASPAPDRDPVLPRELAERVHLDPLPREEMAAWIRARLRDHGLEVDASVVRTLVDRAGPRTGHRVRLARAAYLRGLSRGRVDDTLVRDAFADLVRESAPAHELLWEGLPPYQRAVFRAVAAGVEQLHSRHASLEYDLPVSSAITKAVQILREKGHLSLAGPATPSDPFFGEWIRTHVLTP